MSESDIVNQIQHYQRSIEKYPTDVQRVLRCIKKLRELAVTVQHLQETGVGRTINALRKEKGPVGDASRSLVAKWKAMVVDEERSDCDDDEDNCAPDVSGGYSDNSDSGVDKDENHTRNLSSYKSSSESRERYNNDNNYQNESRSSKNSSNNCSSELSRSRSTSRSNGNNNDKRYHSKSSSSSSPLSSSSSTSSSNHENKSEDLKQESHEKKLKSSRESSSKNDRHRDNSKRGESLSHSNNSGSSNISKIKKENESKISSSEYSKHNNGNSSSSDHKRKRDGVVNDKHVNKRQKSAETMVYESEEDNKNFDDINEIDNQLSDDNGYDKIKIKSESPEPPSRRDSSSKQVSVKKEKSKEKVHDVIDKVKQEKHKHSSSSSSSSKHKIKSESKSSESRKHDQKKDESSSKSYNNNCKDTDKNKHGEKDKDKKSNKNKSNKHKEKKNKINDKEGIDCNSGTSFAEALGMCTASTSSSRKKITTSNISKSTKSGGSSTSLLKSSKIKTESLSPKEEAPLSLLSPSIKLEPLSVDLALPEISANYKPLPVNHMNPIYCKISEEKACDDEDKRKAFKKGVSATYSKTKVYSGNKSANKTNYKSVPSLYELCIRVLIENIDAIEGTGGVPFYILEPMLKRATPEQLFHIEYYNNYLIEDTEPLWKEHCNREFRNKERQEMESWREMYIRCVEEREAKLNSLTGKIRVGAEKKISEQKSTKLAYVNEFVKPPRNILRKQAKHGTSVSTSSSDMKKKLILTTGNNAPTDIAVPPPPMSRGKSSTSGGLVKKNKAPLMAKALQLIKGRYKR